MTLIIVFAVIGFILGVLVFISEPSLEDFFAPFMGAVMLGAIGFFLAVMITIFLPTKDVADPQITLHNLRNDSEINGAFFLGIGTVNQTQYAFYSVNESDGAITFHQVRMDSIRVYEDNPDGAYLQTYHNVFAQDWYHHIGLDPMGSSKAPEFHIPKGSVDNHYQLK